MPVEEEILRIIYEDKEKDVAEIAFKLNLDEETVKETINRLTSAGLLLI